jgi:hypothetical protein
MGTPQFGHPAGPGPGILLNRCRLHKTKKHTQNRVSKNLHWHKFVRGDLNFRRIGFV